MSWTCLWQKRQFVKHETGEGDDLRDGDRRGQALVVFCQPTEAGRLGQGPLHDPPRQQHEPLLRRGQPHHAQLDPAGFGFLSGLLTGVALFDPDQLDGVPDSGLDRVGERADLRPLLLTGRRHPQRQQVPQRVDRRVNLAAAGLLVPVVAGPVPALRAAAQLSPIQNDRGRIGSGSRLAASRSSVRRSRTMSSKQPAVHQRRSY